MAFFYACACSCQLCSFYTAGVGEIGESCLLLAAVPFRLPQLKSGTVCSARGRRLIVIITDFPPSIKNSSFRLLYAHPFLIV